MNEQSFDVTPFRRSTWRVLAPTWLAALPSVSSNARDRTDSTARRTTPRLVARSKAVLNKYLGGYFGSRLMKIIREEKGLTYGIHSGIMHLRNTSFLQISGDVKLGAAEEVISLTKEEIVNLSEKQIPVSELETVKNYMLGEFQNEINTTFDLSTKYKMLHYGQLPSDWYESFLERIIAVTPDQLNAAAKTHFDVDQLHIVAVE